MWDKVWIAPALHLADVTSLPRAVKNSSDENLKKALLICDSVIWFKSDAASEYQSDCMPIAQCNAAWHRSAAPRRLLPPAGGSRLLAALWWILIPSRAELQQHSIQVNCMTALCVLSDNNTFKLIWRGVQWVRRIVWLLELRTSPSVHQSPMALWVLDW